MKKRNPFLGIMAIAMLSLISCKTIYSDEIKLKAVMVYSYSSPFFDEANLEKLAGLDMHERLSVFNMYWNEVIPADPLLKALFQDVEKKAEKKYNEELPEIGEGLNVLNIYFVQALIDELDLTEDQGEKVVEFAFGYIKGE